MMLNTKRSRRFDPTHPGIVWNRTVLFHQKPGRVWNGRARVSHRLNPLQREKWISSIVSRALGDRAYRDFIMEVTRAYGEWLKFGCAEDAAADYLSASVRILEQELLPEKRRAIGTRELERIWSLTVP